MRTPATARLAFVVPAMWGTCESHCWKSVYPGTLMKEARTRAGSLRWSWMALWNSITLCLEWFHGARTQGVVAKENFTSLDVIFWVDSLDSIIFFGLVGLNKELMTQNFFFLKSVGNLSRTYERPRRVKVTACGNVLVGSYSSTLRSVNLLDCNTPITNNICMHGFLLLDLPSSQIQHPGNRPAL